MPFAPSYYPARDSRKSANVLAHQRDDVIMASNRKIRVAIVGLGFGAEFIPIYQNYPGAEIAAICRRSQKDLDECGDRWKIAKRYTSSRRC